jgi:CubicO group peptidase (beta-lactamase class C family)
MGKLDGKIDAVFADMDVPQHPFAALLVIDHDEIVCSKCYGLADLETQRSITTDTSFYLASISKQFTAMAIMLLAEDGRLGYEDRLPAYFPQFPSWGAEISLRHLLHHTSSLPEYVPLFSSSVLAKRPQMCNPCLRNEVSPMPQEGHKRLYGCTDSCGKQLGAPFC